jgi:hypothetical protein
MPKPNSEAVALLRAGAKKAAPPDKLDRLREKVKEVREIEFERASLAERSKELGTRLYRIQTEELVDLFDAAKVDNVGIPEEGNLPAYNMEVGWIIKANIGTPLEPKVEDYGKAITYLKKAEPGLLKTTFTLDFGLGEDEARKGFEKLLKENGYHYSSSFGVPWNTLTSWVKEQHEAKKTLPLKLIGATIERTARLVKPKATRAKKAAQDARSTPKKGK